MSSEDDNKRRSNWEADSAIEQKKLGFQEDDWGLASGTIDRRTRGKSFKLPLSLASSKKARKSGDGSSNDGDRSSSNSNSEERSTTVSKSNNKSDLFLPHNKITSSPGRQGLLARCSKCKMS